MQKICANLFVTLMLCCQANNIPRLFPYVHPKLSINILVSFGGNPLTPSALT